jgi:class 3 adenylate cyclase
MGIDEEGTLASLRAVRRDVVDPKIATHKGRIVRTMGDGLLVEFNSVVDAVRCAVEIQRAMPEYAADIFDRRRLQFRLAINMGDVVSDGDLIYGDGVAAAARMEALAEPGGINVSRAVRDQVRDRLSIGFEDIGEYEVKNLPRPVRVSCSFGGKGRRAGAAHSAQDISATGEAGPRRAAVSESRR